MSERPDEEIVAAVLAGDVEQFGELVGRYQNRFTAYAVRMLGDWEDADEALQTSFVRAFRSLDRCRDPARFGAWLFQIVGNQCRTIATRRGRREKRLVRDHAFETLPASQGSDGGLALREEIERALLQLDVEQREAFLLKHVQGLSYEEMAEMTNLGVSALKMRVKRACDRLRELLEGVHDG